MLWIKLDAVRGMFVLIWQAIETVISWIGDLLGAITDTALKPLQDLAGLVGDLIGDLGEALGLTHEVAEAGGGLGAGCARAATSAQARRHPVDHDQHRRRPGRR